MNNLTRHRQLRASAISVAAAVAVLASPLAGAVSLSVVPQPFGQMNSNSQVQFGFTVVASTMLNRLTAGGTYRISCNNPNTQALVGSRSFSGSALIGPISLYVTVPEVLPATRSLPGFDSVPRGTDLTCTYEWTARAAEANYTISAGGIAITVGGEERTDGNTSTFHMYREIIDRNGCIRD